MNFWAMRECSKRTAEVDWEVRLDVRSTDRVLKDPHIHTGKPIPVPQKIQYVDMWIRTFRILSAPRWNCNLNSRILFLDFYYFQSGMSAVVIKGRSRVRM
jgi:hypothetical protein